MIRSLYTSAMGMIVQEKRQANVSHNLSNVETNGFKKQNLIAKAFDRVGVRNKENNGGRNNLNSIGDIHLGVEIDDSYSNFQQGLLEETNKPLDIAIQGEGFFTIRLAGGEIGYTRDGSFKINELGQLTTKEGYLVLGRNIHNGNLENILLGTDDISIDGRGNIITANGGNHRLNIVNFTDVQSLHRIGENIYRAEGGQPFQGEEYVIRQGFIEKSNVNPLEEMVKMIEITRSFESNQKVVQTIDDTLGKAVNEVGKI